MRVVDQPVSSGEPTASLWRRAGVLAIVAAVLFAITAFAASGVSWIDVGWALTFLYAIAAIATATYAALRYHK